jgi:hypothetical protein
LRLKARNECKFWVNSAAQTVVSFSMERRLRAEVVSVESLAKAARAAGFAMAPADEPALEVSPRTVWDGNPWRAQEMARLSQQRRINPNPLALRLAVAMSWCKSHLIGGFGWRAPA